MTIRQRAARATAARTLPDETPERRVRAGERKESSVYADQFEIYHGNSNPDLARKISRYLGTETGRLDVFEFANENIFVKILDNVREKDVFIVQPTCRPVNDSIMELLIMIDAFKRASAGRITAVVPYYAYGRSDKKDQPRVPITARLVADMITVAGADRMLTMDLHQGQIQGFFNIPVDELTAVHILSNYFKHKQLEDLVVVTDLGFAKRARTFAELLDAPLAIIEKRRVGNLDRAELMNVIGDVKGRRAVIVDDEIDTGGTLQETVRALEREGVHEIYACATHGILSDPAVERIAESGLREVVLTDTVPAATGEADPEDHDALDRAAHRRGDQADPSRRVGRGALQQRGRLHPGDAPLGGRRRQEAGYSGRSGRRRPGRRPAAPRGGHADRRSMSLQLHRPDGKGGLEPRLVVERDWRHQLRSPRWGAALQTRSPARARKSGDESDHAGTLDRLLAGPRGGDVRHPRRRLRNGVLAARPLTSGGPQGSIPGRLG